MIVPLGYSTEAVKLIEPPKAVSTIVLFTYHAGSAIFIAVAVVIAIAARCRERAMPTGEPLPEVAFGTTQELLI